MGGGPVPWTLDIHVLDVGIGDSTLIIADGGGAGHTSMLIDAGLAEMASTVHEKVVAANLDSVDTILVSHYDRDHSAGVATLLLADNLWHLCNSIALVAVSALPAAGTPRAQIIARATARAAAAEAGAWGRDANLADAPGNAAANGVPAGALDPAAALFGFNQAATKYGARYRLVPGTAAIRSRVAMAAGIAVATRIATPGNPATLADVQDAARTAAFFQLQNCIPAEARFDTEGKYRTTRVIDIGSAGDPPQDYLLAVQGEVKISNIVVNVPTADRESISVPALGSELLWDPAPPDQNAPVAIVISTPALNVRQPTGTGWNGPNRPVSFRGGTPGNCTSIGIVLVFRDFSYFTAGDLPVSGENPIGNALVNHALPDGRGGFRGAAFNNIESLRCSHHGSEQSTSDTFVGTILPVTAMISSGINAGYNFPRQRVIDTLQNQAAVLSVFLTNCDYTRRHVPRSDQNQVVDQLAAPNNKMWVAGDRQANHVIGRNRGDIKIHVDEAWATQVVGGMSYQVSYWEDDPPRPAPPTGIFTATVSWP